MVSEPGSLSSSSIRAQGCHGFDPPTKSPNFSLQFRKYQKYCPKLALDRSLDLARLKWFCSIDLVPRVLIHVPSNFPALIWSFTPSICDLETKFSVTNISANHSGAAEPHAELQNQFRRTARRRRNPRPKLADSHF